MLYVFLLSFSLRSLRVIFILSLVFFVGEFPWKACFPHRQEFSRALRFAWWLKRNKLQWKSSRCGSSRRVFRAIFQRCEGCVPVWQLRDENCEKLWEKSRRFRLLFASAFSVSSTLEFSRRAQPNKDHTHISAMKWLKAVYIIPTTFGASEEIAKRRTARRSLTTSKTLRLARSDANSKNRFHLLLTKNSFSPRFSHRLVRCVTLVCSLWK